jgi:AraC family transcriptional regulator
VREPLSAGRFHGKILGAGTIAGIRLTEAALEPQRRLPRHSHELAFFCLLLDGGYREDYGSRTVVYRPFTVAYHPPGEPHRGEMSPSGARVLNVELSSDWFPESRTEPPSVADVGGGELTWLAARLFREYRDGLAGPPVAAESLVLEMLALAGGCAARPFSGRPRWLSRAVDYVESEFRRSLRISEVAREVGAHPTHLSRVFRRRMRVPIGEYVHRLRVRYASEELCRPGARLADVATAAGFADQSHMTRVFKRLTGVTPGDFRR